MKKRREQLRLTMKQVASEAGISESMYCLIENGKRNPSLRVLQRLAVVLHCTIDELVNEKESGSDV